MRALWLHSHIATLTIPATGLQSLRGREFAANKLRICVPGCGRFDSRVTCGGGVVDMDEGGLDSEGKTYASRNEMWEAEAGEDVIGNPKNVDKKRDWYHKGVSYWEVRLPIPCHCLNQNVTAKSNLVCVLIFYPLPVETENLFLQEVISKMKEIE